MPRVWTTCSARRLFDRMDLNEFRRNHYLFDPIRYGNIYVFIDFSNVRHWAKSFWPEENRKYFRKEIDIQKLAGLCDLIKPAAKFFYYGHFHLFRALPSDHPLNRKHYQSIFRIDKARKSGFTVRTKEIKEIDSVDDAGRFVGRINKCNFDIEIAMDMLLKIEKYNTVLLWSGDSDFHFLLQYLQSKHKKIVTICARKFASDELRRYSDLFIPADPFKELLIFDRAQKNTPGLRREV